MKNISLADMSSQMIYMSSVSSPWSCTKYNKISLK